MVPWARTCSSPAVWHGGARPRRLECPKPHRARRSTRRQFRWWRSTPCFRTASTTDGVQALLGSGARLGGKGEPWRADDGSHGVWRSYHPLEQVRVSWHADADGPRSLVDLHHAAEGDGTRVSLRHEPAGPDRAAIEQRWSAALDRLDALA